MTLTILLAFGLGVAVGLSAGMILIAYSLREMRGASHAD